jgi:hypothetical protein
MDEKLYEIHDALDKIAAFVRKTEGHSFVKGMSVTRNARGNVKIEVTRVTLLSNEPPIRAA